MRKNNEIVRELGQEKGIEELKSVLDQLDAYCISPPSTETTYRLIERLKPVLLKEQVGSNQGKRFRDLMADTSESSAFPGILQLVGCQAMLMNRWFIILTAAFMALGLLLTSLFESSSAQFLVIVSPFLGLISFFYEYRAQLYKVEEMEGVCCYSPAQVATARILVVLGYNVMLCTLATLIVEHHYNVIVWKMILNWLAPLVLLLGIALFVSLKLGITGGFAIAAAVWITQITFVEGSSFLHLILPNVTGAVTDIASVLLGSGLIYYSLRMWRLEKRLVLVQ